MAFPTRIVLFTNLVILIFMAQVFMRRNMSKKFKRCFIKKLVSRLEVGSNKPQPIRSTFKHEARQFDNQDFLIHLQCII